MKKPSKIEELKKIAAAAGEEISRIETAEKIAAGKRLIGKTFKYRNNYSCPEKPSDYWWLYVKVVGVDEYGGLELFEFQTDKHGEMFVRPRRHGYIHMSGYQPIPASEFNRQYRALQSKIKAVAP